MEDGMIVMPRWSRQGAAWPATIEEILRVTAES